MISSIIREECQLQKEQNANKRPMNKLIFLLNVLLLTFNACTDKYSKDKLNYVHDLGDSLYVEGYHIYGGGVYGGDVYTEYLTDSISFRKYIGDTEDHESIHTYQYCKGWIIVFKTSENTLSSNQYRLVETNIYDIKKLKEEGKWE